MIQPITGPYSHSGFGDFISIKLVTLGYTSAFKAGSEMACFAVFFTIFKLLFLFGIKELGQSVAGKLVAKCLKKKS